MRAPYPVTRETDPVLCRGGEARVQRIEKQGEEIQNVANFFLKENAVIFGI